MKNTFGNAVSMTIFGESHGPAVGAVLDGLAAGLPVDEAAIAAAMDRRRARGDGLSTARTEADAVEFLSGVYEGHTTGTAVTLMIRNLNTRSGDYAKTADLLRPGHADYTAYAKYHGFQDARGGGHFSGRITAALVAGGAIVLGALGRAGIDITTHIARCAGLSDTPFALDDTAALAAQVSVLENKGEGFALLDASVEEPMKAAIRAAGAEGDSVGGILETAILGLPAGVGEPYFDSVESLLSHMAFSVPAVKGIEFGTGFGFAGMRGSEANDAFRMTPEGAVVTATNHNAGINGGIANGVASDMTESASQVPLGCMGLDSIMGRINKPGVTMTKKASGVFGPTGEVAAPTRPLTYNNGFDGMFSDMYGVGAVKLSESLDLVVQLEAWDPTKNYQRTGLENEYYDILGVSIPSTSIPVSPGRNLAVVLETAAINNRQKKMGYNAARELLIRLGLDDKMD